MRIPQKKLNAKTVKDENIQPNFAKAQQFVKYVQVVILHIFTIAISAKQKEENAHILF